MKDAVGALLSSRKFLLMVLDAAVGTALYFVGKYGPEGLLDDMKFLIVVYQPVFIILIRAIATEDAAFKASLKQE